MAIGVWEPKAPTIITEEKLRSIVLAIKDITLDQLNSALDDVFVQNHSYLMKLDRTAWQEAASLELVDLEKLIRFFTLAEMQLPGWDGGNRNPVIYLARILKSRGEFTTELKKWVKANTDNRYLPNGSAL